MEAERSELSLCLNLAKAGRRFSRIMLVVCEYIYRVHIYIYICIVISPSTIWDTEKFTHYTWIGDGGVTRRRASRYWKPPTIALAVWLGWGLYLSIHTKKNIWLNSKIIISWISRWSYSNAQWFILKCISFNAQQHTHIKIKQIYKYCSR